MEKKWYIFLNIKVINVIIVNNLKYKSSNSFSTADSEIMEVKNTWLRMFKGSLLTFEIEILCEVRYPNCTCQYLPLAESVIVKLF